MTYYSINSAHRTLGTSSNFVINLPYSINDKSCCRLKKVLLPKTIYNITSKNNIFPILNSSGFPATQYLVSIPVGAYSISQLITQIN